MLIAYISFAIVFGFLTITVLEDEQIAYETILKEFYVEIKTDNGLTRVGVGFFLVLYFIYHFFMLPWTLIWLVFKLLGKILFK